ncbi:MAG: TolC family protein, partial [Alphaproteobacteria bacterium]|nr:TolC family protein [Alphaproteobacteria bacterium]
AAQRARERAQLIEAGNLRDAALIDLRRLIGADADAVIDLVDPIAQPAPAVPAAAPTAVESALKARPELRALSARLMGAELRQQAAAASNKPTINLTGGVDYANPNPRIFPRKAEWQESWDVGVNVNWSVFDFGRSKAQIAEAAAAAKATRARIAELESVVSADVRQRLLDRESAHAIVAASDEAVNSAVEARRVIADRFGAGVATSTDVIVAQVAQLETELARTRALANLRLAEARLERTIGGPR